MSEQKHKNTSKSTDEETVELPEAVETPDVDDLLDEIDSVLEENAEQFVDSYVQKGGQ